MGAIFEYQKQLRNSFLQQVSSSSGIFNSEQVRPVSTFLSHYRVLYNPGHQNSATAFEYFLSFYVNAASSGKWEIKPYGSTVWTKFSTGAYTAASSNIEKGIYDTSAVALPAEFKLSTKTSEAGTWQFVKIGNEFSTGVGVYPCLIKVWGPIST